MIIEPFPLAAHRRGEREQWRRECLKTQVCLARVAFCRARSVRAERSLVKGSKKQSWGSRKTWSLFWLRMQMRWQHAAENTRAWHSVQLAAMAEATVDDEFAHLRDDGRVNGLRSRTWGQPDVMRTAVAMSTSMVAVKEEIRVAALVPIDDLMKETEAVIWQHRFTNNDVRERARLLLVELYRHSNDAGEAAARDFMARGLSWTRWTPSQKLAHELMP